jgi:hypothetical protein
MNVLDLMMTVLTKKTKTALYQNKKIKMQTLFQTFPETNRQPRYLGKLVKLYKSVLPSFYFSSLVRPKRFVRATNEKLFKEKILLLL